MRLLLVLSATAALVVATEAAAKGTQLQSATICGSHACTTITDPARLRELPTGGVRTTVEVPPPAAYFVLELVVRTDAPNAERFRMLYVPSETIVAVYALKRKSLVWLAIEGSAIAAMEAAAGDLEPFRAPAAWPDDVPLRPEPAGFDWSLVSGSLLVAVALGLTALLLLRRSRRARPEPA